MVNLMDVDQRNSCWIKSYFKLKNYLFLSPRGVYIVYDDLFKTGLKKQKPGQERHQHQPETSLSFCLVCAVRHHKSRLVCPKRLKLEVE